MSTCPVCSSNYVGTDLVLCSTHERLSEAGFVHLVVIDPIKSKGREPYRTGQVHVIKKDLLKSLSPEEIPDAVFYYIDTEMYESILDLEMHHSTLTGEVNGTH